MNNFNLINIITEKKSELKLLDKNPLVSNTINGARLTSYQMGRHKTPEHALVQNLVVVHNSPDSILVKRRIGDSIKDDWVKPGNITIIPSNVSHSACWEEDTSFILLFLDPTFLSLITGTSDLNMLEIKPQFSKNDPVIYQVAIWLKSEFQSYESLSRMYLDSIYSFIGIHILEKYSIIKTLDLDNSKFKLELRHDIREAIDYIHDNYHKDFGLQELSQETGLSFRHLRRLFKINTGQTPHEYLLSLRLRQAARKLRTTDLNIFQVTESVGFRSTSNFYYCFTKKYFMSPCQYQKINKL